MARKRYSDKDALKVLPEIEVHLYGGMDVAGACRQEVISSQTCYYWRKKLGGLDRPYLSEMKTLKRENDHLKKIVADLQLDKLILKESLDNLRPKN